MIKKPLPIDATTLHSKTEFSEVYRLYGPQIHNYILRRTADKAVTEDLTSIVFIKAWKARASFKGGSALAWLYQISRNVLTDYWRSKKDVPLETDPVSENETFGDTIDKEQLSQYLRRAIASLPTTMHAVITMKFIEGRSGKEVATVLGLNEGNVRVLQYRALKRIRKYLDESQI